MIGLVHIPLIDKLLKRGWFAQFAQKDPLLVAHAIDPESFQHELARYRDWHGEEASNASLDEIRYCTLPDRPAFRGSVCKWPDPKVTWHAAGTIGRISEADFRGAVEEAFGYWKAVCGVQPSYTSNSKTANVLMKEVRLGGAGGVLADSGLPCGFQNNNRQINQRYDAGESWVISDSPQRGQIDLVRVACHEIGHALGSDHIASGNLLAPTYSVKIRKPQAGDVAEMVKRYGPPKEREADPDDGEMVIRLRGQIVIPGYRVTKLER